MRVLCSRLSTPHFISAINSPIEAPLPIKVPPLFPEGYPDSKIHIFAKGVIFEPEKQMGCYREAPFVDQECLEMGHMSAKK